MALYNGVSGVAREISKKYDGVNGVAREIENAYDGVNGVAREYFSSGTPLSSLAVGSRVYIKVNGVSNEFIVVNQGLPSAAYDSSCDGTWLMMKDLYKERAWDSNNNDYANSDVHAYLNSAFLGLFDSNIQSVIKQVKIPYTNGMSSTGSVASGANGLSTKVFLLSRAEVGFSGHYSANVEGAALTYFVGDYNEDRIAYFNGTSDIWWLRSPFVSGSNVTYAWRVISTGSGSNGQVNYSHYIRPVVILPSTLEVDGSHNVKA